LINYRRSNNRSKSEFLVLDRDEFRLKFHSLRRYALGGFDGEKMVQSIEVFDPRLGVWTMGEPMVHPRGYCAAVVVNESIYMIGGVRIGEDIVDKVSKSFNLIFFF